MIKYGTITCQTIVGLPPSQIRVTLDPEGAIIIEVDGELAETKECFSLINTLEKTIQEYISDNL